MKGIDAECEVAGQGAARMLRRRALHVRMPRRQAQQPVLLGDWRASPPTNGARSEGSIPRLRPRHSDRKH